MRHFAIILFVLSCNILHSCKRVQTPSTTITDTAMVVAAREEAAKIGAEIMKKGGNAFDAMVAVELSLAVSYPFAGNIGGGGFMVYRTHTGETGSLDYREKAPLAATRDMYLDKDGNVIPGKSTLGGLAVGVPGTLHGIFSAHEKFGKLPMEQLIQPAIDLAKKGIIVTSKQAKRLNTYKDELLKLNDMNIPLLKEEAWKAGDTLHFPAFAQTLARIKQHGLKEFYEGETGKMLIDKVQTSGGIITMEDLKAYKSVWREAITTNYKDLKIISMPPPSSGGIALAQLLSIVEDFPLKDYGHNTAKTIQVMVEAERRVYADRATYLGDPDFVKVPKKELLNKEYLRDRMRDFSFDRASLSEEISEGKLQVCESNETTHYSIVDGEGNAVSVTTTLNGAYGSKLYVEEGGFFLNNEMDDFSAKPGTPNMFGLIGNEANAIAPEKRMLSSMTPTIVEQDGKLKMVLGSPGGSTIITSVFQNILNVFEFGMGMQESVSKPRFHHQWLPDVVKMEPGSFSRETISKLRELGYQIDESNTPIIGKVDAILLLPDGRLEGGADPRGDDIAVGF